MTPRSRSKTARPLSELEGVVLGQLATAPATAYALRQFFLRSPNPYWSGSAGAIYPLVVRLAARGLVAARSFSTGRRNGREFSLTPGGRAALLQWLRKDMDDSIVGVPFDPLRTRLRFLDVLPPAGRRALVARALVRAREHLAVIDEDCAARRAGGHFASYHVARGAQMMMQARIAWLEEVKAAL